MNEVAFFTVVYEGVRDYLDRFFCSLQEQSYRLFDVVIINNGLKGYDFSKFGLEINTIDKIGTPAAIREYGINYVKDNYEVIVFGDSDDYFHLNRVEKSLELLEKYDIVVNDMTLVDQENRIVNANYLSKRLKRMAPVSLDFIKEKNVFGFTNTAVRSKGIETLTFAPDLVAVDWFFFSVLLSNGLKTVFTNDTVSYYRQYQGNTSISGPYYPEDFKKGLYVKKIHYRNLASFIPEYRELSEKYDRFCRNGSSGRDGDLFLSLGVQGRVVENPLWWENIRIE